MESNTHHYFKDCKCKIPIIDGCPQIDFNVLDFTCPKIWSLYKDGLTGSVFQLGSYLGKRYSKELQPDNINDAAALIAIIRPGVLQSKDENGKSLTQVYCDRKTGRVPIDENEIYKVKPETLGILVFQEEVMLIAEEIAGFSKVDSLNFMKTCAKKKAEALFAFERQFVEGCTKVGIVSKQEAQAIFDNIKASSRYLFNLSHSVSYAVLGAQVAWVKSHMPYHYLCAWLRHANETIDPLNEVRQISSEARSFKINIKPPSLTNYPTTKFFIKDKSIYFGLNSIKGCSDKTFVKYSKNSDKINLEDSTWTEFLVLYSSYFNKTHMQNMIRSGALDFLGETRMKCEFEYGQWQQLNPTERNKAAKVFTSGSYLSLEEVLKDVSPTKIREKMLSSIISSLRKPPIKLTDSKNSIVEYERSLLGINISCAKTDRANVPSSVHTCMDVNNKIAQEYVIVGEITDYRDFKIKNGKLVGQRMAVYKLTDTSGECDIVCFPNQLEEFESVLFDTNVVMIKGKQSYSGGLIMEEVYEV